MDKFLFCSTDTIIMKSSYFYNNFLVCITGHTNKETFWQDLLFYEHILPSSDWSDDFSMFYWYSFQSLSTCNFFPICPTDPTIYDQILSKWWPKWCLNVNQENIHFPKTLINNMWPASFLSVLQTFPFWTHSAMNVKEIWSNYWAVPTAGPYNRLCNTKWVR